MVPITEDQFDKVLHKWYGSGEKQGKSGGITYFPKPPYNERYKMKVDALDRTDPASLKLFHFIKSLGWEWGYEEYDAEFERHDDTMHRSNRMAITFYPVYSDGKHIHSQKDIERHRMLCGDIQEERLDAEPQEATLIRECNSNRLGQPKEQLRLF